ncbi:hypothetical protein DPMN_155334 [Dreissena polymorpha]|uniref:Uncharacterized protein n=1 Tax=Dreissena polymorpha TaxID=45954 RepID=A0A9D4FP98_DREPO|nr:hypothetical protein DPMN_155334 [Dreissena polymorpha]
MKVVSRLEASKRGQNDIPASASITLTVLSAAPEGTGSSVLLKLACDRYAAHKAKEEKFSFWLINKYLMLYAAT